MFVMMIRARMQGLAYMADDQDRLNPEVAEIVSRVLGELSLDRASEALRYALSRSPLRDLKKGKIGREKSVRTFAEGFWKRICEHYREEVTAQFGDCNQEACSDWLALKAGFGIRHRHGALPTRHEAALTDDREAALRSLEQITDPEKLRLANQMLEMIRASERRIAE
jgi:hypothetical protein